MSKANKIPNFLYDWRSAIVAFPAMFLYGGFLPILKLCGVVSMTWLWALSPIWFPFLGYWIVVGFISFLVLVVEIGFMVLPDKNIFDGKGSTEV